MTIDVILVLCMVLTTAQNVLVAAQFPLICNTNLTKSLNTDNPSSRGAIAASVCCPSLPVINPETGAQFASPCGYPVRGECSSVPAKFWHDQLNDTLYAKRDMRYNWPQRYFRQICHCKPRFYGPRCEQCWFGFEGPNCDRRTPLSVRRNVMNLNASERIRFQTGIHLLQQVRVDDLSCLIEDTYKKTHRRHGDRSDRHGIVRRFRIESCPLQKFLTHSHYLGQRGILGLNNPQQCKSHVANHNHNGPGFATWHRHFMLVWERLFNFALKNCEGEHGHLCHTKTIVGGDASGGDAHEWMPLPYWDWTEARECEVCRNDLICDSDPITGKLHSDCVFSSHIDFCKHARFYRNDDCLPCPRKQTHKHIIRRWKPFYLFPSVNQIRYALSAESYAGQSGCDFVARLEGICGNVTDCTADNDQCAHFLHNQVHYMTKESPFSSTRTSTNDPLFPLHHTQADRLLARWMTETPTNRSLALPIVELFPGHCRDCSLVGTIPRVCHKDIFVPTENLGYVYEDLQFGGI